MTPGAGPAGAPLRRRLGLPLHAMWLALCSASAAGGGGGGRSLADDRAALLDIFDALGGPGWTNATGWGSPTLPVCLWWGVKCNGMGTRVTYLCVPCGREQGGGTNRPGRSLAGRCRSTSSRARCRPRSPRWTRCGTCALGAC